jgi:hypothetical protein
VSQDRLIRMVIVLVVVGKWIAFLAYANPEILASRHARAEAALPLIAFGALLAAGFWIAHLLVHRNRLAK